MIRRSACTLEREDVASVSWSFDTVAAECPSPILSTVYHAVTMLTGQ